MTKTSQHLRDGMETAGTAIRQWFSGLNPEVRSGMLRALAGAAVGGTATGALSAFTPHDPEERHPVLGPALTGAALGGTAAAGIPLGLKLLSGGIRFPSEPARPAGAHTIENLTDPLLAHPLTTAGAIGGGLFAKDSLRTLAHGMTHTPANNGAVADPNASVLTRLHETLAGPESEKFWHTPRTWHMQPTEAARDAIRASRGKAVAAVPLAMLLGMAGDKYLKGEW